MKISSQLRALLASTLCLYTLTTWAQSNLFCSEPQFLSSAVSGTQQPYFLGPQTKLTHFSFQNLTIPRLLTVKRRTFPSFLGQALFIKEGGPDGVLGTSDDIETQLSTPTLNNMVAPRIGDFDVHGDFLVLAARDYPPGASSGPAMVILVHLNFGGTPNLNSNFIPGGEMVVASYPFINSPNFISDPLIPDVNIDSNGLISPLQPPLVSWVHSFNQMHSQNGDDLYYCRFDQCSNPVAAGINQPLWAGIHNGAVTEHASSTITSLVTPLVNLNIGGVYEKGIYAKDDTPQLSTYTWLDNLGANESLADQLGSLVFYFAPLSQNQPQSRLHVSMFHLSPTQNSPLFSHSHNSTWQDGNLKVSKINGFSSTGYYSNPQQATETFFGWDHTGPQLNAANGFKVTQSQSYIHFLGQNSNPVPLSQVLNVPAGFFTYFRGISRNLFIVSALPSPLVYGTTFPNYFKNSDNDLVSFYFYCAN